MFKPCFELKQSEHSTCEQKSSRLRPQTHIGRHEKSNRTLVSSLNLHNNKDTIQQGQTNARPIIMNQDNGHTTLIHPMTDSLHGYPIEPMGIQFSDIDLTIILELQRYIKIILLGLEQLDGLL